MVPKTVDTGKITTDEDDANPRTIKAASHSKDFKLFFYTVAYNSGHTINQQEKIE